jgi:undecaprenol kinase
MNLWQSKLLKSFSHALSGISLTVIQERNMRIHVFVAVMVIAASFWFSLNPLEWLFVLLCIGGMFALEMMNTAIEKVVNLVTMELHPLAKQAKDIAAGAVFIYAILSVVVGLIIFLPKVLG